MRQLLDIVHQRKQLPLPIDLFPAAQREAVQALVITQVAKRRFDRAEPFAVAHPTDEAVDLRLHAFDRRTHRRRIAKEHDLTWTLLTGIAQAACP